MKGALLILVFCGCTLFGLWIDKDERKRLKELEQFIYLFELLKGEISYQLTPLCAACYKIAEYAKGGVGKTFVSFSRELEVGEKLELTQMWQAALISHKNELHLKTADYQLIDTFGDCCGDLDKVMQTRYLEMLLEKLRHLQEQAEEKYERCAKLNRSLGVLIGGALVIFLI